MEQFANWLSATRASLFIQDTLWIVPTVQTAHILAIAMALSSVGMITLRILGFAGLRSTMAETVRRYAPWIWGSLVVLALTGAIMITGEPTRSLTNAVFQLKMLLLAGAIAATVVFQIAVRREAAAWGAGAAAGWRMKAAALLTFLLWTGIVVAGRWIAYWADNQ